MSFMSSLSQISGWYRLFIITSIIWMVVVLIGTEPWGTHGVRGGGRIANGWEEFLALGVLPIVILWGVAWVLQGFKKDKKHT